MTQRYRGNLKLSPAEWRPPKSKILSPGRYHLTLCYKALRIVGKNESVTVGDAIEQAIPGARLVDWMVEND